MYIEGPDQHLHDMQLSQDLLFLPVRSVHMIEWLLIPTLDHEVLGSNTAGGRIQLMAIPRFIAKNLSLSLFHCLDMT